MDTEAIQRSWDAQQQAYLPDREARFAALLDLVEASGPPTPHEPRVLDLAGGTGSITRRLRARFPRASSVVVDHDPVLLAIARATFADDPRVLVVAADLDDARWTDAIPPAWRPFDAVLTATALHWLEPPRVAELYVEVTALLRRGGVFGNADHMPDPGLPALSARLAAAGSARGDELRRTTGAADWESWCRRLRDAGFDETGLTWRGRLDALAVGVRSRTP